MKENPLLKLESYGQSIWLDFLSREMLVSGELVSLFQQDGVTGITSNPATFEKAITAGTVYDTAITELARKGLNAGEIYETLAVDDITMTADLLRPVFDRTSGRDGYVSLEVSPRLAHDAAGTLVEARRLWERVARPNVFIKVPGTVEGVGAIRQLIREGLNINVTLLFSLSRYRAVSEAYLDGLAERAQQGMPLDAVASVASFFLSRIDVLVDPMLDQIAEGGGRNGQMAVSLRGQAAIACAKVARRMWRETIGGERYLALSSRGARPQRVLWASTGTKDPAYTDVKYVEPLLGADTINTVPLETLAAYRDHGNPLPRLDQGMHEAQQVLDRLRELGIDLEAASRQLEDEGVEKFTRALDGVEMAIEQKRLAALR